jgi:type IV fimbrial biogenesis protein FimT
MKNLRGFTIIELLITLVVGTILLTMAVPSFTSMIRNNRITAQANEFITTINLARSEAIRRGATINVSSTSGTNAWQNGWSMTLASDGTVLRQTAALEGANTLSGGVSTFAFSSQGYSSNADTLTLCNSNTTKGRQIDIALTGRISVKTINTCP